MKGFDVLKWGTIALIKYIVRIPRVNSRSKAYEPNFNISLEDPANCGCVDLHEYLSELFHDRCFFLNSVLDEYDFRIKKVVSIRQDASLTPSSMRGAKCYGNVSLFIYLFLFLFIIVKLP